MQSQFTEKKHNFSQLTKLYLMHIHVKRFRPTVAYPDDIRVNGASTPCDYAAIFSEEHAHKNT